MMENLTREQVMTDSVITHVAKKDYTHQKCLDRQAEYKRIVSQDCYGVQKRGEKIAE